MGYITATFIGTNGSLGYRTGQYGVEYMDGTIPRYKSFPSRLACRKFINERLDGHANQS